MNIADMLVDKIYTWQEQQEEYAQKLKKMSLELESHRKNVNISQVVGSTASVGGAAAILAAGALTLATGGALAPIALPILSLAGGVTSGLGAATSMGSDVVEMFISSSIMKDAEKISHRITDLEKEIQRLTELLIKEAEKEDQKALSNADITPETYVVGSILKAMAERSGVKWHENVLLLKNMSNLFKTGSTDTDKFYCLLGSSRLSVALLSKFILKFTIKIVLEQSGTAAGKNVATKCLTKLATEVGPKLAVKSLARVGGGAIGLAFAIPEMIDNFKDRFKGSFKTEVSQSLQDTAEILLTTAKELKRELNGIRQAFKRLAKVNRNIENLGKNAKEEERKELLQFVIENCEDEGTQEWLKKNSNCRAFLNLVEMFHFLKTKIDEEEKTNHFKDVDIIFVAHGAIEDSMVPASCLMPLGTIQDVILYTPWNCYIDADAAYAVATGCIKPHHREFVHGKKPTKLPNEWNSIKKTGKRQIPNIILSQLHEPEDGFWKKFEFLKNQYGLPRHRIVVPYMKDSRSSAERVPFYIVTLALSLVLIFSRFKATLHLTTCLGRYLKEKELDQAYLESQYACTEDNTTMTVSELQIKLLWLFKNFQSLFS